jgi:hypothetical protein
MITYPLLDVDIARIILVLIDCTIEAVSIIMRAAI